MPGYRIKLLQLGEITKVPKTKRKKIQNQKGASLIEVLIAIVILTIGILAQLSTLTYSIVRVRENEKRNVARQIASSAIESIFAARDLGSVNGLNNWESVNLTTSSPDGKFVPGWHLTREDPGVDGIHGTADDACFDFLICTVGGYSNSSEVDPDFERQIVITDISEAGYSKTRKRKIEVSVRYFVGQIQRQETLSTVIADLPFYN